MSSIHPTAIIEKGAEIAESVTIGAYTVIGPNVIIGPGNRISHQCNIAGHTTIGANNIFSPFCSIGTGPQDIGYKDEPTKLFIGDNNTFKEFITINTGTMKDSGETSVGSNNYLMAYCHVGHDGVIGDNIIMANGVQLGGHVKIENYASLGGLAGVHHLVTIGEHSFVGGTAKVIQDVPPYMIVEGNPGRVRTLNTIGLQRRGFSKETVNALEESYRLIWRSKVTTTQAFQDLLSSPKTNTVKEVLHLIKFLQNTYKGKFGRYKESLRKVPAR
jgi:UDP-N-acetylglucosamine acyltransferase